MSSVSPRASVRLLCCLVLVVLAALGIAWYAMEGRAEPANPLPFEKHAADEDGAPPRRAATVATGGLEAWSPGADPGDRTEAGIHCDQIIADSGIRAAADGGRYRWRIADHALGDQAVRIEDEWPTGDHTAAPRRLMQIAHRLLVRAEAGASPDQVAAALQRAGVRFQRRLSQTGWFVVQIEDTGLDAMPNARQRLAAEASIAACEPDYIVSVAAVPDDPDFDRLWGLENTGQEGGTADADVDAPEAWGYHTGSQAVRVAVIDTGVDRLHPDLAENCWVNPGEDGVDQEGNSRRDNGIDDDGNGYIDDWRGWDFVNDDNDPHDDHFHGTHCAGTIGAVGDNGTGVAGVCWQVSIVPIKFLSSTGGGATSDAIAAIEYATSIGCHVLSNSWGGGARSQALEDAIRAAAVADVLFIAAAGNDGRDNDSSPQYPASYEADNIIAVASSDRRDGLSSFSNYGRTAVDLAAPGSDIYSTFPTAMTNAMRQRGFQSYYETISGTSMATPHVAGAAALIWSLAPELSYGQIRSRIFDSVDPLPVLDGLTVTGGRLNVATAMRPLAGPAPDLVAWELEDAPGGNGDGFINPGETIGLRLTVANVGSESLPAAFVSLDFDGVQAVRGYWPADRPVEGLDPDQQVQLPPFSIDIRSSAAPERVEGTIRLTIDERNGAEYTWPLRFDVVHSSALLGQVVTLTGHRPVVDAVITIDGVEAIRTQEDGSFALPLADGSYDMGVTATGYTPVLGQLLQMPSDPLTIELGAPSLHYEPDRFDVVLNGAQERRQLRLYNEGDLPLHVRVSELRRRAESLMSNAGSVPIQVGRVQQWSAQDSWMSTHSGTVAPGDTAAGMSLRSSEGGGMDCLYLTTLLEDGERDAWVAALEGLPQFDSVTVRSGWDWTPAYAELSEYGCVVVSSASRWQDPVATGDALADYVDGGGMLVLQVAAIVAGSPGLQGRVMETTYNTLVPVEWSAPASVSRELIDSPLTAGVSVLQADHPMAATSVSDQGLALGTFDTDYVLGSIHQKRPILSLNHFPWRQAWSGDWVRLIGNFVESEPDRPQQSDTCLYLTTLLSDGERDDWVSALEAMPMIDVVEVRSGRQWTPTASELTKYAYVVVSAGASWQDSVATGDALADYVDAGGMVVLQVAAIASGGDYSLQGRIMEPEYNALVPASGPLHTESVSRELFDHPLLEGVVALRADAAMRADQLTEQGVALGVYDNGYLFGSVHAQRPVLSLNWYPRNGEWSGDWPSIVTNFFEMGGKGIPRLQLSQDQVTIPPGMFRDIELIFDEQQAPAGDYAMQIELEHDDPRQDSPAVLPVDIHVVARKELIVEPETLVLGPVAVGEPNPASLTLRNEGNEPIVISHFEADHAAVRFVDDYPMELPGYDSLRLDLSIEPEVAGPFEALLSIHSDADGLPVVQIPLQAVAGEHGAAHQLVWDALPAMRRGADLPMGVTVVDRFGHQVTSHNVAADIDLRLADPQMRISEIALGGVDGFELQNLSDFPVQLTGWSLHINASRSDDRLASVDSVSVELDQVVGAGDVLVFEERQGWPDSIRWQPEDPGWVLLLDDAGVLRDAVFWGWTNFDLAFDRPIIRGLEIDWQMAWLGPPVPRGGDALLRQGRLDHDRAEDWIWSMESMGTANGELSLPWAGAPGAVLPSLVELVNGRWQGNLIVDGFGYGLQLTSETDGLVGSTASFDLISNYLDVLPAPVDFATVVIGHPEDAVLSLVNRGFEPTVVSELQLSGTGMFTLIDPPALPLTIPAAETAELTIRFAPEEVGQVMAELVVISDAEDRPELTVPLSGSGAAFGTAAHIAVAPILPDPIAKVAFPVDLRFEDRYGNLVEDVSTSVSCSLVSPVSPVLISECVLDETAGVEIVNVSDTDIDLTGWRVVIGDDRNAISEALPKSWQLASILTAGGVRVRRDSGLQPWGRTVTWDGYRPGWVVLLDRYDRIVDAVVWRWSAEAIAEWRIAVDGRSVDCSGAFLDGGFFSNSRDNIQRVGSTDTDSHSDFINATGLLGQPHEDLVLPMVAMPAGLSPTQVLVTNGRFQGSLVADAAHPDVVLDVVAEQLSTPMTGRSTAFTIEPEPDARITVEPSPIDFGSVVRDASVAFSVTVSNVGSTDLALETIDAQGLEMSTTVVLPVVIEPGVSLDIAGTALPTSVGPIDASLRFGSNAVDQPALSVPVVGEVLAYGPVDHFSWTVPDEAQSDVAFDVRIEARDVQDHVVGDFVEVVDLSVAVPEEPILLSEVVFDGAKGIELQNMSDATVDVDGWVVLINEAESGDDPWVVHPDHWRLSDSLVAGEIDYRQGSTGEQFWRAVLGLQADRPGWVMLVDDKGGLRDLVIWGWNERDLDGFYQQVNGRVPTFVSGWVGVGVPLDADRQALQRVGERERQGRMDWRSALPSLGGVNEGLVLPFPDNRPVLLQPRRTSSFHAGVIELPLTLAGAHRSLQLVAWHDNHSGISAPFSLGRLDDQPVAVDDEAHTDRGVAVSVDVLANDEGFGYDLTIELLSPPSHGQVQIVDGEMIYQPSESFVGVDRCHYAVVNNAGGRDTASLAIVVRTSAGPDVLRVDAAVAQPGDGSSWHRAFKDLDRALQVAAAEDEVWLANGSYRPGGGRYHPDASFRLPGGVSVYGGFRGDEDDREERSADRSTSVLVGMPDGERGLRCRHVIDARFLNKPALVDGVSIIFGQARGDHDQADGGGVIVSGGSLTLRNCAVMDNYAESGGGGVFAGEAATLRMEDCLVAGNSAAFGAGVHVVDQTTLQMSGGRVVGNIAADAGGGVYHFRDCIGTIEGVVIAGNEAIYGGGVYGHTLCTIAVENCVITGNRVTTDGTGAGLHFNGCWPIVQQSTIVDNHGGWRGAGCFAWRSWPPIVNCIAWGNEAAHETELHQIDGVGPVSHSCVQDWVPGSRDVAVIRSDPLFIDGDSAIGDDGIWRSADDGYRLQDDSPCVDSGTVDELADHDIAGLLRPRGAGFDIGAYEGRGNRPPPSGAFQASTDEDQAVVLDWTVSDPDGDRLVWQLIGEPSHGALSGPLPAATYTPQSDWHGVDHLSCWVSDGLAGAVVDLELTVLPQADAPIARLTASPLVGAAPCTVAFDATGSSDVDGDVLAFAWDFDGDGTIDSELGPVVTYDYAAPGLATARVTVSDPGGLADEATIAITVQAPPVWIQAPAIDDDPVTGVESMLRAQAGDPDGDDESLAYHWECVQMPTEAPAPVIGDAGTPHEWHVRFGKRGRYHFRCVATDEQGWSVTATVEVMVLPTPRRIGLQAERAPR